LFTQLLMSSTRHIVHTAVDEQYATYCSHSCWWAVRDILFTQLLMSSTRHIVHTAVDEQYAAYCSHSCWWAVRGILFTQLLMSSTRHIVHTAVDEQYATHFLLKFVDTFAFLLKSDVNNGHFTWRPTRVSVHGSYYMRNVEATLVTVVTLATLVKIHIVENDEVFCQCFRIRPGRIFLRFWQECSFSRIF
jgi:glutathionyl-hydroquinone reductase